MWRIFHRWGRIKEVFIPIKTDRRGRRFGFVCFFDVGNAKRIQKEFDAIIIRNKKKIHVNGQIQKNTRVHKSNKVSTNPNR